MKAKILTCLILLLTTTSIFAQNYTEWESTSVKFYEEKIIRIPYDALNEEGEEYPSYKREIKIYVPTKLNAGTYQVEVCEKESDTFYKLCGTDIYVKFSYSLYLYNYDEGVLRVFFNGSTGGEFYKKPD